MSLRSQIYSFMAFYDAKIEFISRFMKLLLFTFAGLFIGRVAFSVSGWSVALYDVLVLCGALCLQR